MECKQASWGDVALRWACFALLLLALALVWTTVRDVLRPDFVVFRLDARGFTDCYPNHLDGAYFVAWQDVESVGWTAARGNTFLCLKVREHSPQFRVLPPPRTKPDRTTLVLPHASNVRGGRHAVKQAMERWRSSAL